MYDEKYDIKTNPNLVTALGVYIRTKRLAKNIGLREMADKLNISPAYLSNLENGKHNMTNPLLLKHISKILELDHLTLYKIIGYTDKDKKELKQELWSEIYDDISDDDLKEILKSMLKMSKTKIQMLRHYVQLLEKNEE